MIYLDNSSTTKPLPRVAASLAKGMEEVFGNPSSLHRIGLAAEKELKSSKQALSSAMGSPANKAAGGEMSIEKTLFFTSGGTEADNTALFGMAEAGKRRGNHIITTSVEHPAILEACKALENRGFRITFLPVAKDGSVSEKDLLGALCPETIGVSVMSVNNELGTIYPVKALSKLVHEKSDALFHTDAVQAFGKVNYNGVTYRAGEFGTEEKPSDRKEPAYSLGIDGTNIDLVTVSGHKIHGPKGIGALYVKEGVHIPPFIYGGGQENHFRSGTENMPGILGMGEASRELCERGAEKIRTMIQIRDYLRDGLLSEIPDITINGPFQTLGSSQLNDSLKNTTETEKQAVYACPSVLNVSFLGCRGEVLLHTLEQKDIYVSTGSACSSNSKKKGSHVLQAAGLSPEQIEGAIRFSFSGDNTVEEMDIVIAELKTAVLLMRRLMHRK